MREAKDDDTKNRKSLITIILRNDEIIIVIGKMIMKTFFHGPLHKDVPALADQ